jgi:hypothetical protein
MCTQKPPHDYSQQLLDKYRECFEEYINSMVIGLSECNIGYFTVCVNSALMMSRQDRYSG